MSAIRSNGRLNVVVSNVTCFAVRVVAPLQRSRNGTANVVRADVGVLSLILLSHILSGDQGTRKSGAEIQKIDSEKLGLEVSIARKILTSGSRNKIAPATAEALVLTLAKRHTFCLSGVKPENGNSTTKNGGASAASAGQRLRLSSITSTGEAWESRPRPAPLRSL